MIAPCHTLGVRSGSLLSVAILAIVLASIPSRSQAGSGGPTITQPVEVTGIVSVSGPVEVQGAVQTTDDSMNEPYAEMIVVTFNDNGVIPEIHFEVPEGKRLIVETISLESDINSSSQVQIYADAIIPRDDGPALDVTLPFQQTFHMYYGQYQYVATHSVKLRINGGAGGAKGLYFQFLSDKGAATGDARVTVLGYLVDL